MIYVKPNGTEVEVNATSAAYAESLGWKPKQVKQEVKENKPKHKGK